MASNISYFQHLVLDPFIELQPAAPGGLTIEGQENVSVDDDDSCSTYREYNINVIFNSNVKKKTI